MSRSVIVQGAIQIFCFCFCQRRVGSYSRNKKRAHQQSFTKCCGKESFNFFILDGGTGSDVITPTTCVSCLQHRRLGRVLLALGGGGTRSSFLFSLKCDKTNLDRFCCSEANILMRISRRVQEQGSGTRSELQCLWSRSNVFRSDLSNGKHPFGVANKSFDGATALSLEL